MATARRGKQRKRAPVRNDQVVRVLRLLRELHRLGGVDLYELAQHYGTSVRTIRRDLKALAEADIPLKEEGAEDSQRKRWSVDSNALKSLSSLLDVSHYLALRVAMGQGGPLKQESALFAALEEVADRIETALGPAGRAQLAAIDRCFASWEKFAWSKAAPDLLWPLVTAISNRQLCQVTYRTPGAPKEKSWKALPLRLFVYQGAVYLHAWVPRFDTVVTLNLQRLLALKVLPDTAEPPKHYSTDAFLEAAFGVFTGTAPVDYRLRFSKAVAPFIGERTWHPTQALKPLRDGGVELTFRCAESYEVTAWIASWREAVEVLEPARLRKELRALGEWLGRTYAGA